MVSVCVLLLLLLMSGGRSVGTGPFLSLVLFTLLTQTTTEACPSALTLTLVSLAFLLLFLLSSLSFSKGSSTVPLFLQHHALTGQASSVRDPFQWKRRPVARWWPVEGHRSAQLVQLRRVKLWCLLGCDHKEGKEEGKGERIEGKKEGRSSAEEFRQRV